MGRTGSHAQRPRPPSPSLVRWTGTIGEGGRGSSDTGLLGLNRPRTGLGTPAFTLPPAEASLLGGCPSWQPHVTPCPQEIQMQS